MVKILLIVFVIAAILGGLGYWRYTSLKSNSDQLGSAQQSLSSSPIEVPATLPQASIEDRVKALEDVVSKLAIQVNSLKPSSNQSQTNTSTDSTVNTLNTAVTDLTARVTALEKSSPTTSSVSQSVMYIPLGSGGYWQNTDWFAAPEYQISLDPANYPGYTSMILEVTFRVIDSTDVGSVRLYNATDNSATSLQVDSSSSSFVLLSTPSFKLATGAKTYKLQVKSNLGRGLFIQTARIKVSF